jgi:isoleucyl-tRNA synthetase
MPEWKDTVNLPRTDFPMKANLPTSEPETLARWNAIDLYGKIRARRAGAPKFVLHDGPPYANGNIHMGTALNKILKELVVKSRSMAGFDAPYLVGYDCHGLPIELKVDRELGPKKREMSVADFCRACRAYAERYIGTMTEQFKRLGILGTWDEPYLTMDFRYQAAIARAFGKFVEQGLVYKGKKPVHWCIHCRTALAEAEVEYEDHSSPSIYVEFPLATDSRDALGARVPGLAGRDVSVLIWTTTPWTIPSNLAVAFHPKLDYAAYDVDGRAVVIADKDETGRSHARFVATALRGVAKKVKLIELPDRNVMDVKDAHDFFVAGGTADELRAIVEAAPEFVPAPSVQTTAPMGVKWAEPQPLPAGLPPVDCAGSSARSDGPPRSCLKLLQIEKTTVSSCGSRLTRIRVDFDRSTCGTSGLERE